MAHCMVPGTRYTLQLPGTCRPYQKVWPTRPRSYCLSMQGPKEWCRTYAHRLRWKACLKIRKNENSRCPQWKCEKALIMCNRFHCTYSITVRALLQIFSLASNEDHCKIARGVHEMIDRSMLIQPHGQHHEVSMCCIVRGQQFEILFCESTVIFQNQW